jgi:hypothetical protein
MVEPYLTNVLTNDTLNGGRCDTSSNLECCFSGCWCDFINFDLSGSSNLHTAGNYTFGVKSWQKNSKSICDTATIYHLPVAPAYCRYR